MIIKQNLYITDPLEFAKGRYENCFNLVGYEVTIDDWICCGPIEIEVNVDMQDCIDRSLSALDAEEKKAHTEFNTKLALIEQQKAELLCLTHDKSS